MSSGPDMRHSGFLVLGSTSYTLYKCPIGLSAISSSRLSILTSARLQEGRDGVIAIILSLAFMSHAADIPHIPGGQTSSAH